MIAYAATRSDRPASAIALGELHRGHRQRVVDILRATNAFRDEEIDVALELFDEAVDRHSPDYQFVGAFTLRGEASRGKVFAAGKEPSPRFAQGDSGDSARELIGYACYGATPGTLGTYDLYWIAVHPDHQGAGGGSRLLDEVERRLTEQEARLLVVETSSRTDYESTRRFYERRGYGECATISDFYAPGDDRVIYARRM